MRLGNHGTIGLGSSLGIGVEAGDGCQVGALSVVPKFTRLEAGGTYGGVPVRRIDEASVRRLTRRTMCRARSITIALCSAGRHTPETESAQVV